MARAEQPLVRCEFVHRAVVTALAFDVADVALGAAADAAAAAAAAACMNRALKLHT